MPPKKEEPPKPNLLPEVIMILVIIYFLYLAYWRVSAILAAHGVGSVHSIWARFVAWFLVEFWPIVKGFAICVVAFATAGITYSVLKLRMLDGEEEKIFASKAEGKEEHAPATIKNDRWERVITHLSSPNDADWRLAVLEADIMLDDLLNSRGYHGDSIGDKLKAVDKSDFTTIENAWAAHKIRNQIAHQGADYPLNEREAKQAVALYESVFKEFKII